MTKSPSEKLRKARREVKRLGKQFLAAPGFFTEYFFSNLYNDLYYSRRRKISQGRLPSSNKIAIYLIFPKTGIQGSHLAALDYIYRKGYAPLVVSNSPLSPKSREILLEKSWRLIERENFGYDFGGYRDGILSLGSDLSIYQRIALLNDSSWFPIPRSSDWLSEAEDLEKGFVSATSHNRFEKTSIDNFRTFDFRESENPRDFHYASFALMFSDRILSSPKFRRFWVRMRLSTKKRHVIRRGEYGLTRWVVDNGYSHGETFDSTKLKQELDALSNQELGHLCSKLISLGDERTTALRTKILEEVRSRDDWKTSAINGILLMVSLQGAGYTIPHYFLGMKKMGFLKKSPLWLDETSSVITEDLAEEFSRDCDFDLLTEAQDLRKCASR